MTSSATTTATAAGTHVLTRDDVTALRGADEVMFHYGPQTGSIVRAGLRGERSSGKPRVYSAAQQLRYPNTDTYSDDRHRDIPCGASMFGHGHDTEPGWRAEDHPRAVAFEMFQNAAYNAAWRTIVELIKPGDALTLQWAADNNSDTVRKAGLHVDELRLLVRRGDRTLTFHLQRSITPDNSARMIRRHG